MTEFFYNNEERLRKLQKEVFGEEGTIKQTIEYYNLDVYKFLISMSIWLMLYMNRSSYEQVKAAALLIDGSKANRVFFEKCDAYSRDVLYFQDFMKGQCKNRQFCDVYYTYFHRAA